jgi:hypothetical protein
MMLQRNNVIGSNKDSVTDTTDSFDTIKGLNKLHDKDPMVRVF